MKKNHKKKYLALAIVLILLSIAIAGGSLAWFTATDQVTNVFTVGSIAVQQLETDENGNPFQQNQMLMPILGEGNVEDDPNFIHKIVTVRNTGDNPAYLRTWVALPSALEGILCYEADSTHWEKLPNKITANIGSVSYNVWCYVYQEALSAGSTTQPLLKGVYLDSCVEIQDDPADNSSNLEFCTRNNDVLNFSGFEIFDSSGNLLADTVIDLRIATQAVQTEGFTDPTEALNTAFGTVDSAAALLLFQNP